MKLFVPQVLYWFITVLLVLQFAAMPRNAIGQVEVKTECGAIVESEFGQNEEEHIYLLNMAPGESFTLAIEPVGDFLKTIIVVYGPSGIELGRTGSSGSVEQKPTLTSGTVSARGIYKIRVANSHVEAYGDKLQTGSNFWGGVGTYQLLIGCVLRDGTIIDPGDAPQPTPTPAPVPEPTVRPALPEAEISFTGIGFAGLAPVDFSAVAEIPLLFDTAMTGVIPTGNEILGFILDAETGDTLDLSYTRRSGNMNLGLVVLSETNEVYFQASLVTSESLSTRFTLPEAGQYTIGVFRISLVEPEKVEPTVFQLQGSLGVAE